MGNLYLSKGELSKAIGEFEKALSLRPDFPEARNNLAMAYAADRQYDRALAELQKLIELDPDTPSTYYNIAVLYALQNKVTDSLAWLKKAVAIGYNNWELIKTDKDLENIRNSDDYKQLVKGH
jgi:Flp pilus assembly protein TadD